MALETGTYVSDLVITNPDGSDSRTTSDDHHRLQKKVLKNTLCGFTGGVVVTGTDGGSANAYTVTPTNALPSYTSRLSVIFSPTATNTGASTINVSGLGAKDIKRIDGTALVAGDLASGSIYVAIYTGTEFRLMAPTKNYIDQLSLGAAYPATVSDAGKFLKYTGSAYAWDYAGISTVGATVTDNYTITSTTPTIWPCATTAIGKSITAPAVSSSTPLGLFAVIDNRSGGYPVGWRDSTSALVGGYCVGAGGFAEVYLEANGTAAGTWRMTGTNLEPGLITIDSTFSSTYASTVLAPFVALDSNTSIHFAALSSGFAAFVVDNTGKTVGTPVTVSSTASSLPRAVFKVSATTAIVFYGAGSTDNNAVVLSVSGTSISVGTPATTAANTSATTAWGLEDFSGAPRVAQLSSTLYLASYVNGTTNTSVVAVSVSGTTVTIGSAANIIAANSVAGSNTTYALTATTALVIYQSGAGTYAINGVIVSVSGTTCTVGTPASSPSGAITAGVVSSCLLAPTKALIASESATPNAFAVAITISGTILSFGSATTVEASTPGNVLTYTASSATRYNPHLFPLSSSTALLWYLDSSGISRAVVLSESGGTVTAGTKLYRSVSAAAISSTDGGVILPQGTDSFLALRQQGGSASWQKFAVPHKISGTTVTQGAGAALPQMALNKDLSDTFTAARLSSGDYVLSGSAAVGAATLLSLPVLRTNGDAITYRGEVKVPALGGCINPVPVVSSNRIVLLAETSEGTTVSTSTRQLRLLNVEIAA